MNHKTTQQPINANEIHLKPGSGQNLQDHVRGKYWHIMLGGTRVGKVYIDFRDNEVLGMHPSIDIFINKQFQGRHIGRYAYEFACKESGLSKVYMHTRKSNIGSIRAAEEAGFNKVEDQAFKQIVMVWTNPTM